MRARAGVALLAMAALFGAAPPGEAIFWQVTPILEGGEVRRLDLQLTFPGDADGETLLALPSDWGGEQELWRSLWDIRAAGAEIVSDENPAELVLRHAPGAPVTLSWKVGGGPDAPPAKTDGNDYRPRFADGTFYIIGHTVLPSPEHLTGKELSRARIDRPQGLTLVSDLDHAGGKSLPFDDLAQSAIFGGDIRVIDTGTGARLAVAGAFEELTDADWQDSFTRIAAAQRKYWKAKDAPFLVTVMSKQGRPGALSYGGTGLGDAFSIFATPNTPKDGAVRLMAHEMMHSWVPGKLGRMPETDEPVHYWLSEGFTDWATFRTLVRAGLWTPEDFAGAFNASASGFDLSPARNADAAAILAGFWSDSEVYHIPYRKGMLIATWLDANIREKTKGRHDLDDVLLRMQKMARKDPDALAYDNLLAALKKVARWDAAADLEAMAMQGAPVVLPENTFAPCGPLSVRERARWQRGFDFAATQSANWTITGVIEGSNAHKAGLRDGMTLTRWSENARDRDPEKEVTAGVLDEGTERSITWLPASPETRDVRALQLTADTKACRKRLSGL